MNVLILETTCDETAAAVVAEPLRVLSSVVASQNELHSPFGGVVPEIAARAHIEILDRLVERVRFRRSAPLRIITARTRGIARKERMIPWHTTTPR